MKEFTKSELDFIERIDDYIDLEDVDSRTELLKELQRRKTAQSTKGFQRQMDILGRHLGFVGLKAKRKKVAGTSHRIKRYTQKGVTYNVVAHKPKCFKRRQIRDVKTGKILKWVD